uniref:Protein dopey-1 homolog n=1 Tax=Zeugodacus cucurbitae TaxID=28588 RepID=A0A0A1XQH6_ZEUCU
MESIKAFIRAADAILEFEESFAPTANNQSAYSLEVQQAELKSLWAEVKSEYKLCLPKVDASDTKTVEDIKLKYTNSYHSYVCCAALMGEHMHNLTGFNQSPSSNSTIIQPERLQQTAEPVRYSLNLPPCDTEIFHGDVLQWPSFRDLFAAIYGNNSRLSPVEKLFHLNQKTRGEAKAIVSKAPLTNDGFALAWNNLLCRYENKRVLVNTQLNLLFKLPHISTESEAELRNLQREINSCISALQIHGINIDSWDALFTYLCSIRLPDYTLSLWEQSLDSDSEIPKWVELDKFLTKRVKTLERVSNLKGESITQPKVQSAVGEGRTPTLQSRTVSKPINSHHVKTNSLKCKLCSSQAHILKSCQRFIEMQPNARLNAVRKLHVCLNCLSDTHEVKDCKSMFNCAKCKQRHHTMIHRDQSEEIAQSPASTDPTEISTKSHMASIKAKVSNVPTSQSMLLGTAMVTICHNENTFTVRALIDSGSEGTFITSSLQKRLNLTSRKVSARVSGLNNTVSGRVQTVCSITIGSPRNKGLKLEAEALVLPKLTGLLPSRSINPSIVKRLPNIPLADNNFHTSQKVDLLIGGDIYPKIILNGVKSKIFGSLIAQRTVFGWILTGSVPSEETKNKPTYVTYFNEVSLDNQLSKFQELEEIPKKPFFTVEEQYCDRLYSKTTIRNSEARYIVSLPFKVIPAETTFGASRHIALKQKRKKWKHSQQNVQVNDLVVVRAKNLPPNEWRLGRITKIYPGMDQRVRVVDIKTQRGLICKPITKNVILPNQC